MDHHLRAAGAPWEPGADAGGWIGPLLDEFGPTLGHAVPAGYEAYAVVPIPWGEDGPERYDYAVLGDLIRYLAPVTGDQVVHTAMWEGWGWLYGRDEDPRTAPGMGVSVIGSDDPADLRRAQEEMARERVARSDASYLELPHRSYGVWAGPLSSVAALRHQGDIPSLIWPQDRSWFIGAPIYTSDIAVGASEKIIRSLLAAPPLLALGARRADREQVLDIDD